MNMWIIAAIIIGLLAVAGIAVALTTTTTATEQVKCENCGNSCTAGKNCGSATCGAINGGKCGCK